MSSNFYSILTDNTPPTCQVDKQDNDPVEQVNNINELKQEVLDGSIPSAIADTRATLSMGTKRDRKRNAFVATGRQLDKAFCMPNGEVEETSNKDKFQHNVRHPAKDVHIVPGIERDSLLSIPKFADTNYVTIFNKDKVNIYNANKTKSSSLVAQSSKDGDASKRTYGKSPSSKTSRTTTLTQSSAIDA